MKTILRCHIDFILPDDFEGTVPEAMRLAADYLETGPPGISGSELDSKGDDEARAAVRNAMLANSFHFLGLAEANGQRCSLNECAVHRKEKDGDKWERRADEMVPA